MNDKKTVSFGMALAIIFLPILVILLGGLVLRVGFLVPLMLATITASLLSIMAGFTWKEVEACIVNGVHRIIIVTCILFLVGTLIGVWIQAGVIPLFLYWGLKLLSPSMFLVSTVLICAVFSLMTGTSFGTIGTAGLALLGVGEALGFPTGLTAGAIVSGAYFGDKMSPVSDTTNLASGITGTNIFSHIGSMLYTTVPATLVALGLYWYLGLNYSGGAMPDLTPITDALSANFNRSFLLALPPIVLVALAIRGIPPLPTLVIAILVGVVCAFVIQDGMTVKGIFKAATDGYVSQTGHPLVDKNPLPRRPDQHVLRGLPAAHRHDARRHPRRYRSARRGRGPHDPLRDLPRRAHPRHAGFLLPHDHRHGQRHALHHRPGPRL